MEANSFLKLVKNRRSTRRWTTKPVEDEKIQLMLTAGIYAPSAANCQKTRFQVIKNKQLIAQICKNTSPWFQNVYPPTIITVLFDLDKPNPQNLNYKTPHPAWSRFIWQDTACAMMNMMLTAEALGLKTCWASIIPSSLGPQRQRLRELLKINRRYILACFLFVGYSNEIVDINKAKHSGLPIKRVEKEHILTRLS